MGDAKFLGRREEVDSPITIGDSFGWWGWRAAVAKYGSYVTTYGCRLHQKAVDNLLDDR